MNIPQLILSIILFLLSLFLVAVVLLQEGRQANLGAIAGAADSFMEKGKARTMDALLAKWTKVIAITFFVLVFAGMLVTKFLS